MGLASLLGLLAAVFAAALMLPADAWAALQYKLPDGTTVSCPNHGLFTGRVVLCVQAGLEHATTYYLALFSQMLTPAIWASIVLAVTYFGVKVATGQIPPHRMWPAGTTFVFKIGIVTTFALNMGNFAPAIYHSMTDIENIVTASLMPSSSHCSSGLGSTASVWDRLDYALGRVIGFGAAGTLTGGLLALIGGGLFSGIFAVGMFFVGIIVLFIMIMAVLRPVWVFLLAYTAISFFLVLAPAFIPLLLFRPTVRYFEKWLDQVVLAMLQPVMVFGFLAFFMVVIDFSICGSSRSFDATVGGSLASHLRVPKPTYDSLVVTGAPGYDRMTVIRERCKAIHGNNQNAIGNCVVTLRNRMVPAVPADTSPTMEDSPNYVLKPRAPHLDFGSPAVHNKKVQSITSSLLGLLVVFYLLLTTAQYIPSWAGQMVGTKSFFDVTQGKQFIDKAIHSGIDQARKSMKESLAKAAGATKEAAEDALRSPIPGMAFVRRGLPSAGEGFISGVASKTKSKVMQQAKDYIMRKGI